MTTADHFIHAISVAQTVETILELVSDSRIELYWADHTQVVQYAASRLVFDCTPDFSPLEVDHADA
jgi:hypothetical protein